MTDAPDWPRDLYVQTDQSALLFYLVFGDFQAAIEIDEETYGAANLPKDCQLMLLNRDWHSDYISTFFEGYVWKELLRTAPQLAIDAQQAQSCIVLRWQLADPPTLNYFRDAIGVLTCLVDRGGTALYDPFQFRWWRPDEWRRDVFEPRQPRINRHVVILTSDEEQPGQTWFHTRGMRKFARPEISVRHVGQRYQEAVIDLCERFIQLQARGCVIAEGEEVRMRSLPP